MNLRELYNPTIDALYIAPSADGLTLQPEVHIAVHVDPAGRTQAEQAVFEALRLSVFLDGKEVLPDGGGGTGHEGGYPGGFKAGITVSKLLPDRELHGQIVVALEEAQPNGCKKLEALATFDFVRLRTPAGDYPNLAWPAADLGLTVLTKHPCGAIPPYFTVVSLPTAPMPAPAGYRLLGRAYCLAVADPMEHRPTVLRLPVPGALSDAERESVAAYVSMGQLTTVSGVLCQQGGATSLSILTRRLSKAIVTLVVGNV